MFGKLAVVVDAGRTLPISSRQRRDKPLDFCLSTVVQEAAKRYWDFYGYRRREIRSGDVVQLHILTYRRSQLSDPASLAYFALYRDQFF